MALIRQTRPDGVPLHGRWMGFPIIMAVLVLSVLVSCQMMPGNRSGIDTGASHIEIEKVEQLAFKGRISALEFSRKGQALTVGGCQDLSSAGHGNGAPCAQGAVQVWNLDKARLEASATYPRAVTALAVSPDGSRWVIGDLEGRLILSSASQSGRNVLHQKDKITALAFSPDGKWVASGSLDPSFPLGLMDLMTGGVIKVKTKFEPVTALAFSPDGKTLAVGMVRGRVALWNFTSPGGPSLVAGTLSGPEVTSAAFSPDGEVLAYGRQDGKVVIVDRGSGKPSAEYKGASAVNALAFSPDGRVLALGQDNGRVLLIDSQKATQVWFRRHTVPITDLAYSPDGSFLAVAVQQQVYLYYLGGSVEPSSQLHRAQDRSPNRERALAGIPPAGASRAFARVLELSQQEFIRLLPFDRLVANAVTAMAASIPGASFEPADVFQKTRAHTLVVRVNQRTVSVDLARLRRAEGRAGIQESVQAFESVRQFLLAVDPRASARLEDIAVKAVVTELGPSVRLVQMSGEATTVPAWDDAQVVKEPMARLLEEGRVPYLKVSRFSASTAQQVNAWLQSEASPHRFPGAPILDLRDNPGDELDSVEQTASLLIPKDQLVASLVLRKTGDLVEYRSRGGGRSQGPFVVLVNERTAGTAEMLACAMQAAGVGFLVGTRTAGVDEVYRTFALPGGGGLRVSSARFDCPDGQSLRWKGRDVDLSVNRLPSDGVVSLGVASSRFLPGSHRPVHTSVDLPGITDRSLILGAHVALCLGAARGEGDAPQRDQATARLKHHLTSCEMSPS